MIKTFKIFETFNSNFWKWFGNSKMIDEQGNPIVAYHGTNRKFDEFKNDVGHTNDLGFYGVGFYFTFGNGKYSKEEAGYYGNNIIEVYLKIENPYDFSKLLTYKNTEINIMGLQSMVFLYNVAKEFPELSNNIHIDKTIWNNDDGNVISVPISIIPKLVEKYKKKLKYTEGENNRGDKYKSGYVKSKTIKYDYTHVGGKKGSYVDFEELGQWLYKISDDELEIGLIMEAIERYDGLKAEYHPEGYMTRNPKISELIKKKGYDGIVQSMEGDEVVVFNSNQIKSVNNNGEYSSSNNINEEAYVGYTITELNDAIVEGNYSKFIKILNVVKHKIDCTDNIDQEWTPLIYAVNNERPKMVKVLLKYGANMNLKTIVGNSALMIAASIDNIEIIEMLINVGADWNIKNKDGNDFIDYLKYDTRKIILDKYPKQYENYLTKKKAQKYNIL